MSSDDNDALGKLLGANLTSGESFNTAMRGYNKAEVDGVLAEMRRLVDSNRNTANDLSKQLAAAEARADDAEAKVADQQVALKKHTKNAGDHDAQLKVLQAELATAHDKIETLSNELMDSESSSEGKKRFDEVLRIAEEQAGIIIKNAAAQGDRLIAAAREEIDARRADSLAEAQTTREQAEQDAAAIRLKMETEQTAHQTQLDRERTHSTEMVSRADKEAAAIRAEADKGAATLRKMVARETELQRAEAEEAVREQRLRALELEEAHQRRTEEHQQEFLTLHNQAVAHAERITTDANAQVQASLDHASRVQSKAEDHDRLMRAQSKQIQADAQVRAREIVDRAHERARRITELVNKHATFALRDSEDRASELRRQQSMLQNFQYEIAELMRIDNDALAPAGAIAADAGAEAIEASVAEAIEAKKPAKKSTKQPAADEASDASAEDASAEDATAEGAETADAADTADNE